MSMWCRVARPTSVTNWPMNNSTHVSDQHHGGRSSRLSRQLAVHSHVRTTQSPSIAAPVAAAAMIVTSQQFAESARSENRRKWLTSRSLFFYTSFTLCPFRFISKCHNRKILWCAFAASSTMLCSAFRIDHNPLVISWQRTKSVLIKIRLLHWLQNYTNEKSYSELIITLLCICTYQTLWRSNYNYSSRLYV